MSNVFRSNNHNGRAFALASGFGSAMGSGMAVASASTSAFIDNQKIQAARPSKPLFSPTSILKTRPDDSMTPRTTKFLTLYSARPAQLSNGAASRPTQISLTQHAPTQQVPRLTAQKATVAATSTTFAVPDNVDPNPIVIRKKPSTPVNYTQHVSVKFLQPPPPQQPGDIVITQQKDVQAPPVKPRLMRQKPPLPIKPAPLIVRERPPLAPAPIAPEHHVIPGKVIPPPPRKVVVERLPQLPQPPQDIIVERWLEYGPRTRRVVFEPAPKLVPAPASKNLLVKFNFYKNTTSYF